MRQLRWVLAPVTLALICSAHDGSAQEARAQLVESARLAVDDAQALDLLRQAADPTSLPIPDSAWAEAVYDIASILFRQGLADQAQPWLRWAARVGAPPPDPGYYLPSVVQSFREASDGIEMDDPVAGLSAGWRWMDDFDATADGAIELTASDGSVPYDVTVDGRPYESGAPLTPGTYSIAIEADGRPPLRLGGEVLPGATILLEVDLPPILARELVDVVARGVVQIQASTDGRLLCTNGVLRPGGWVVTSFSALPRDDGLRIITQGGTLQYPDVSVEGTDVSRDLALLRVNPEEDAFAVPPAPDSPRPSLAWTVFRDESCRASAESVGLRLSEGLDLLPPQARGGAVVDQRGELLGLLAGSNELVPRESLDDLVDQFAGGGEFPTLWVGAGVAAGAAVALLLLSGGDTPSSSGTIVIQLPGGS